MGGVRVAAEYFSFPDVWLHLSAPIAPSRLVMTNIPGYTRITVVSMPIWSGTPSRAVVTEHAVTGMDMIDVIPRGELKLRDGPVLS